MQKKIAAMLYYTKQKDKILRTGKMQKKRGPRSQTGKHKYANSVIWQDFQMTRWYGVIYTIHAAKSSSPPNLTGEAGESEPQGSSSSLHSNTEMDLMYSIMFGLRSAQGSRCVLFAGMLSSFWGEHFILPALWGLSHRLKYSTIYLFFIRRHNSLSVESAWCCSPHIYFIYSP